MASLLKMPPNNSDKLKFPKVPLIGEGPRIIRESKVITKINKNITSKYSIPTHNTLPVVHSRNLLKDATAELRSVRRRSKIKTKNIDAKWEALILKENSLKLSFQKFEEFVRLNQDKRFRLMLRIEEDRELAKKRLVDIKVLRKWLNQLHFIKRTREEQLKANKMFENYLLSVVDLDKTQFATPDKLVVRYDQLVEQRDRFHNRQASFLSTFINLVDAYSKEIEQKNACLLGMKTVSNHLQSRYDLAKQTSLVWEQILSNVKFQSTRKEQESKQVALCVDRMYKSMRLRKPVDCYEPECTSLEDKFANVNKSLLHLVRGKNRAQKRTKIETKNIPSSEGGILKRQSHLGHHITYEPCYNETDLVDEFKKRLARDEYRNFHIAFQNKCDIRTSIDVSSFVTGRGSALLKINSNKK